MRFHLYSSYYNFHYATWYCYYQFAASITSNTVNECVVVNDGESLFLWTDRVIE
jgi:hypothetical protein